MSGAGTACASERTIKIATLVTDSTTERDVSEIVNLVANDTATEELLTSFTDTTGAIVVRVVAQKGSGYSGGTFALTQMDTSTDGTIVELNVLPGTSGERIGMVWRAGTQPALTHTAARTSPGPGGATDEEISYNVTLDTTA